MRRRGCGRRSGACPTLLTTVHAATPLGRACRLRVPASSCVSVRTLRRRAARTAPTETGREQRKASSHAAGCSPVRPACDPLLHPGKEKAKKTITWVGPNGQSKKSVVVPGQKLRDIARVRVSIWCRVDRVSSRTTTDACADACVCACARARARACACLCACAADEQRAPHCHRACCAYTVLAARTLCLLRVHRACCAYTVLAARTLCLLRVHCACCAYTVLAARTLCLLRLVDGYQDQVRL
jgi:hypothetical protein